MNVFKCISCEKLKKENLKLEQKTSKLQTELMNLHTAYKHVYFRLEDYIEKDPEINKILKKSKFIPLGKIDPNPRTIS